MDSKYYNCKLCKDTGKENMGNGYKRTCECRLKFLTENNKLNSLTNLINDISKGGELLGLSIISIENNIKTIVNDDSLRIKLISLKEKLINKQYKQVKKEINTIQELISDYNKKV